MAYFAVSSFRHHCVLEGLRNFAEYNLVFDVLLLIVPLAKERHILTEKPADISPVSLIMHRTYAAAVYHALDDVKCDNYVPLSSSG